MSDDRITEVTSQSWFSRIGDAFKGMLVGLVLVIVSIPLIVINEKSTADRTVGLNQAQQQAVSLREPVVDSRHEGQLVHVTGEAVADNPVSDEAFGIRYDGLRLSRNVEMFQWQESQESTTEKKLGGGTETVTEYNYAPAWSTEVIDSAGFYQPQGHNNPGGFPVNAVSETADPVQLGEFVIPPWLVESLRDFRAMDLKAGEFSAPEGYRQFGNYLYSGDPQNPQVGDVRISWFVVDEGPVSLLASQYGNGFESFYTDNGTDIAIIKAGRFSKQKMFHDAHKENTGLAWVLRLVYLGMIVAGLYLLLNPLKVIADVVPLVGDIVAVGAGTVAFLVGLVIWAVLVAISWVAVRPLVAVPLLVVAAAALWWLLRLRRQRKVELPAEPEAPV